MKNEVTIEQAYAATFFFLKQYFDRGQRFDERCNPGRWTSCASDFAEERGSKFLKPGAL